MTKLPRGPLQCNNEPDPRRFWGKIRLNLSTEIGHWEAYLCNTPEDLGKHLNQNVLRLVGGIPASPPLWPIAYLKLIYVSESYRNKGHGSFGLQRFQVEAKKAGAALAFARIGWSSDSPREKNIYFYEKAGWSLQSEVGEDGLPKLVKFAYLVLGSCSE